MKIALTGDKWEMGWDTMSLEWSGCVAEQAHGICTHFPLFDCTAQKIEKKQL